jgi:hypothetical protein
MFKDGMTRSEGAEEGGEAAGAVAVPAEGVSDPGAEVWGSPCVVVGAGCEGSARAGVNECGDQRAQRAVTLARAI